MCTQFGSCALTDHATDGKTITVITNAGSAAIGTYFIELAVCYNLYPLVCATPQWIKVTVGTVCSAGITGPSALTHSIDLFEASATAVAVAVLGSTATTAAATDCALSWSITKHMDTPSTLTATVENGGSAATEGSTAAAGLMSATATERAITVTSTDFQDVGVHIFYLNAWYTNFPDDGSFQ